MHDDEIESIDTGGNDDICSPSIYLLRHKESRVFQDFADILWAEDFSDVSSIFQVWLRIYPKIIIGECQLAHPHGHPRNCAVRRETDFYSPGVRSMKHIRPFNDDVAKRVANRNFIDALKDREWNKNHMYILQNPT